MSPSCIEAPISIGELIDKISILEIKAERIRDALKRRDVLAELRALDQVKCAAGLDTSEIARFADELKAINTELWDIEDEIRALDARQDFGARFIAVARSVYLTNDRRARVKQQINTRYGSTIVEQKSYSTSVDDGAAAAHA